MLSETSGLVTLIGTLLHLPMLLSNGQRLHETHYYPPESEEKGFLVFGQESYPHPLLYILSRVRNYGAYEARSMEKGVLPQDPREYPSVRFALVRSSSSVSRGSSRAKLTTQEPMEDQG